MKNILIILTFFFVAIGLLLFVREFEGRMDIFSATQSGNTLSGNTVDQTGIQEDEIIEEEPDIVRSKIETIKKRLALKGLIIQGDSYYRSQQLALALRKYLEFYKQNPSDPLILEKIADTYFDLKKFASTLNYLKKIKNIPVSQHERFAQSFIYTSPLSDTGAIQETLGSYGFSQEEIFYYATSASCVGDFHSCKESFQTYFSTQSGVTFPPLQRIASAFENYKNFQLDDIALKDAYLIGAWYEDAMYPISISLGESLLQEKMGYKPILKIVAQSYFELGDYDKARKTLGDFYTLDDTDPAVAYMLGVVNEKLKDYILANIYLKKSLDLGYVPSIDVRRQLIHNFYLLENDDGMLGAFSDMVEQEKSLEADDLGLAIYYHILHEKFIEALKWSKQGQVLFPENGDFYAYEGWILRNEEKYSEAGEVLKRGITLDNTNPFLLINLAYTALAGKNISIAKVYFQKTIESAPESEFAKQAKIELETLSQ